LPSLRWLLARGEPPASTATIKTARVDDLRRHGAEPVQCDVTPDQLAMLVYTSGTTGASKGCMLPHNVPCNIGWWAVVNHGFTADDVLWSPLPLFHLNAMATSVMTAIVAKATVAISPRFSVSRFWEEIERSHATIASLLGSMASLIAEAPDNEFS